jgi:chitinase
MIRSRQQKKKIIFGFWHNVPNCLILHK